MAYIFGDSFDLYATMADPIAGYWDSGLGVQASNLLVAGRFSGGQALAMGAGPITSLVKNSSVTTDPVHHITCAFRQSPALTGTTLGAYLQLSDGATNQVCIVFRSDGAILLTSATPAGTALATYTGAVTVQAGWFGFEFEVIISNTVGRFRARKNGNTVDDFDSGATLNTRPGANTQANKLTIGMNASVNQQQIDDLLWRSDATSVPWVGDIRCYTRMPASDATAVFSRSTGATNASCVDEAQQNGTTDYVYDSTVNDADFYSIATSSTPASVVAVTTRGFMEKSDAGTRTATVQLKSGSTTVAASTLSLPTTFSWSWRTDTTDPNTSAAWTASAVDAVTIGPKVVS
jgi:hypothetical protein